MEEQENRPGQKPGPPPNTSDPYYELAPEYLERTERMAQATRKSIGNEGTLSLIRGDERIKVHSRFLDRFFSQPRVEVMLGPQEKGFISPSDYRASFFEGYDKGVRDFRGLFPPPPGGMYGPAGHLYAQDVHDHYHNTFHLYATQGWADWKDLELGSVNHGMVRQIGYYCGLIEQAEEVMARHPALFKGLRVDGRLGRAKHGSEEAGQAGEGQDGRREAPAAVPGGAGVRMRLEAHFGRVSRYKAVMELLVKNGFCQAHTYLWKDANSGSKKMLAGLLKYLHLQGYYRDNLALANRQIVEVALTTFGVTMGEDTAKKVKAEDFARYFSFLPPASTME